MSLNDIKRMIRDKRDNPFAKGLSFNQDVMCEDAFSALNIESLKESESMECVSSSFEIDRTETHDFLVNQLTAAADATILYLENIRQARPLRNPEE